MVVVDPLLKLLTCVDVRADIAIGKDGKVWFGTM